MDFKEYSRLRSIARKRAERIASAGLGPLVKFPTVADIREGRANARQSVKAVQDYLSSGSQLKTVRQTGLVPSVYVPKVEPAAPKKTLTPEEQKAKRRTRQRLYRQRKAVKKAALTPEKKQKYESYLKALQTISDQWSEAGLDIGVDLAGLTPSEAQAFVEYIDYRFSQGDFTQHYVIDEFVQDFGKMLQKGYKAGDITTDFGKFLSDREELSKRADSMSGLSNGEMLNLWEKFIEES